MKYFFIIIFLVSLVLRIDAGSGPVKHDHVEVELISEVATIRAAQPFWIGLTFDLEEHWHIYWRNPGDAGMAPDLEWSLPPGFEMEEVQWPSPKVIMVSGLANFAYEGRVLLMAKVIPPQKLENNLTVSIGVEAEWLVCKEVCLPGDAVLTLDIEAQATVPVPLKKWEDLFARTREQLALTGSGWEFTANRKTSAIHITATPPSWYTGSLQDVQFFPYDKNIYDYAEPQILTKESANYVLEVPLSGMRSSDPQKVSGIIVNREGWRGRDSEKTVEINIPIRNKERGAATGSESIWLALLFAFIGGIILNLMPCVLPVLSIKILGFIEQAGNSRRKTLQHGLIFTTGVLVSFWALAALLLVLRAGGEELGWGFQLQSPVFIFFLAVFMFLFGLNLFGVFEIGLSLTRIGEHRKGGQGGFAAFLSGVTATVVATPCTAPFMGSALGYALTQNALISMLIFSFLGLGMAFPYLVVSFFPALAGFLPKPGA